jgi:hypothetical protein
MRSRPRGFGGELALAMASVEGYVCPQVKKIDAKSARRFTSDEARELNVAEGHRLRRITQGGGGPLVAKFLI